MANDVEQWQTLVAVPMHPCYSLSTVIVTTSRLTVSVTVWYHPTRQHEKVLGLAALGPGLSPSDPAHLL